MPRRGKHLPAPKARGTAGATDRGMRYAASGSDQSLYDAGGINSRTSHLDEAAGNLWCQGYRTSVFTSTLDAANSPSQLTWEQSPGFSPMLPSILKRMRMFCLGNGEVRTNLLRAGPT